jgi:hypothetical protein
METLRIESVEKITLLILVKLCSCYGTGFIQTFVKKIRSFRQEITYLLHGQPIVLKRLAFEANGLKFVELILDYKGDIERTPSPFSQELCYRM